MKTVFIVNPKAGKGKKIDRLIKSIEEAVLSAKSDAEIYITKCVGDAKHFVSEFCKDNGPARFIACGGDGTLCEVTSGAAGCVDAEIGVVPMGTGNDFCRNFGDGFDFSDIESQIVGGTQKCDVIRYSTIFGGVEKEGYCVNMINIGFDCNVADMTTRMKKKPFIAGSLAYFLSILVTMIKKKGAELSIGIDGEAVHDGKLLLTSVANGCFCGGGIKSNPVACVSDGVMNVNIIKNIKRRHFIPLLPHYMKGTILDVNNIDRFLINRDCQKLIIKPKGGRMRLCVDGEITDAGDTTLEVIPDAFNFVCIAGCSESKVCFGERAENL